MRRVLFSPHAESVLASCSYDMSVRLWDWRSGGGAPMRGWDHHTEFAVGLDMSPLQVRGCLLTCCARSQGFLLQRLAAACSKHGRLAHTLQSTHSTQHTHAHTHEYTQAGGCHGEQRLGRVDCRVAHGRGALAPLAQRDRSPSCKGGLAEGENCCYVYIQHRQLLDVYSVRVSVSVVVPSARGCRRAVHRRHPCINHRAPPPPLHQLLPRRSAALAAV